MCSQPSVTVHIQQLESSLGVQLFHRENNRVTLTEAGRYFQTEADQLLQQLDTSFNRLHHFSQGYRRTWQIAISPLMAETMLPYFLKTFQRRHPDVALTIRVEDSKEIEHLVAKDIVQLGVSALDSTSKVLQSQRIYEDPVIFVAPLDQYDDESGPPIDVKEMLQHHYVFTHHHPVYWEALLKQLKMQVPIIRTMKVTQAHIVKRFIQDQLGVSFLPRSIVQRELLEGRLMAPNFSLFDLPTVHTYVITKKQGSLENEFIQHLSTAYLG